MRVVIAIVLGLALASCGTEGSAAADKGKAGASQAPGPKVDRSHAGSIAPGVRFEMRDGSSATVANFKGKPVLVNLWATWCLPCIIELPAIDEMAADRPDLVVLPISADLGGWRAVDKFWTTGKFETLRPRLDKAGNFPNTLKAAGLPMTILYDARGREVWRINGSVDWGLAASRALLPPAPAKPSRATAR